MLVTDQHCATLIGTDGAGMQRKHARVLPHVKALGMPKAFKVCCSHYLQAMAIYTRTLLCDCSRQDTVNLSNI